MDSEDDEYGGLDEKPQPQPKQKKYTVLSDGDIHRRQEEDISVISSVLSISRAQSSILLRHYNWSIGEVHDAWFADEEKVRKSIGFLEKPIVKIQKKVKKLTCRICFEICSLDKMSAAVCGHLFCVKCWSGYLTTSINDGPGCLMLRCPDPSCNAAIEQDLIEKLASNEDKEKFSRYLLRSFIESNRKTKWCPALDCGYAIEFDDDDDGNGSNDVTCHCSYGFCWTCTEEIHRPVDCDTVAKWILEHNCEAESTTYMVAYTKPCPKCKRPMEKNDGCMHMTCRVPCKFEFCWLCLGAWSDHVRACNRYYHATENKEDDDERKRKKARKFLEKYNHYYERWASNQSSRRKALADLHLMQTTQLDDMMTKLAGTSLQFQFITEAWLQIVECRRVLKWTYAYGYYLPDHEHAKKEFFEYLQGQAESGLERLHYCAEKELQVYIEAEDPTPGFNEFRNKLVVLTKATQTYFENLVQALENGLSDVDSHGDRSSKEGSMKSGEVAKARKRRTNENQ